VIHASAEFGFDEHDARADARFNPIHHHSRPDHPLNPSTAGETKHAFHPSAADMTAFLGWRGRCSAEEKPAGGRAVNGYYRKQWRG
jgi:hypothetical protein